RFKSWTTGAATECGSIDYESGTITITNWNNEGVTDIVYASVLTTLTPKPVYQMAFRTAGSPVRPASLQVMATLPNGSTISATADQNGNISSANMLGYLQA